ncbi:MAG: hypothetical protein U5O16_40240 [Rhodococcus sp. (in: high G+C Gram-positive bacteria)]|uniref:hypothetical protein n=1 Tax=Rhodococcus sp. TaxID=1831 RepID=UPI002ADCAA57|nr:hypothetical protein [Rhodococcus sp. (in: high G+C Gram-positive bacteria)]
MTSVIDLNAVSASIVRVLIRRAPRVPRTTPPIDAFGRAFTCARNIGRELPRLLTCPSRRVREREASTTVRWPTLGRANRHGASGCRRFAHRTGFRAEVVSRRRSPGLIMPPTIICWRRLSIALHALAILAHPNSTSRTAGRYPGVASGAAGLRLVAGRAAGRPRVGQLEQTGRAPARPYAAPGHARRPGRSKWASRGGARFGHRGTAICNAGMTAVVHAVPERRPVRARHR